MKSSPARAPEPGACLNPVLPELDIAPFLRAPGSPEAMHFVTALREACHGPGFCYLRGHGVAGQLERDLFSVAAEFFALPQADREALAIDRSPHFRGYTRLGDELTRGTPDWREQLDLGAEEPALAVAPGDPPWRRLRGPNQWPHGLPSLKPAALAWMTAMQGLGSAVLRALAVGLELAPDYFQRYYTPRGDPHLKIMRYPPQPSADRSDQGVGWHHDSGLLSFVLQDDAGGLEVRAADDVIAALPRPGTYVMNLGEMLQVATAGYLRATPHRVRSPSAAKARLSVAWFHHPRLESVFEPITLPHSLRAQARGSDNADPDDPVFRRFGENYLKIRLRSHPDVARRHYADLIG